MYDAWAVYHPGEAHTYLVGNRIHGFFCPLNNFSPSASDPDAQAEAISHAAYRLLTHRFLNSPGGEDVLLSFRNLMIDLGYDPDFTSVDYADGSSAALGNHIGQCYINYGLQDGSNEQNDYGNLAYSPVNDPLAPVNPGNPNITDPNRWQPLTLDIFIDQAGNLIPLSTPEFLSPEWGQVLPFSLNANDLTKYTREGFDYYVYHDPGPPPLINLADDQTDSLESLYLWNFMLVSVWSAHLDPTDSVLWDISPGSIGNNPDPPRSFADYEDYYKLIEGGDQSQGWDINPITGQPYPPNLVPRGDYTRVLAEFWADGPDSETPPGHWFTILNYVSDHPQFEKKMNGIGSVMDNLEWDIIVPSLYSPSCNSHVMHCSA
jgi:hypothetical protein